jgi:hypothetical protein
MAAVQRALLERFGQPFQWRNPFSRTRARHCLCRQEGRAKQFDQRLRDGFEPERAGRRLHLARSRVRAISKAPLANRALQRQFARAAEFA